LRNELRKKLEVKLPNRQTYCRSTLRNVSVQLHSFAAKLIQITVNGDADTSTYSKCPWRTLIPC